MVFVNKDCTKRIAGTSVAAALTAVCWGLSVAATPAEAAPHAHRSARAHKNAVRHVPTPPDSYLQYKVYSVDQLIQQVSSNPTVRKRFARHFQIPESRVVSYMRANLVESYIPKDGRYTVYCARPSGRFYPVHQTFHRGTKVFALRNGEPVMKWVCGNPLSRFLPSVQVHLSQLPPKVVTKVSPSVQELTPVEPENILLPSEVSTPVYQPLVPIQLASAATPLVGHGGANLLPFLLPVALIGVHGGGGGSTNVVIPAVPEPGALIYLAAGVPVILVGLRRRRSVKRDN